MSHPLPQLKENEVKHLSDAKKAILGDLEDYILECPGVTFVGAGYNTTTGEVTLTVGGPRPRALAIAAPLWVQRLQIQMPDIAWKLNIVRGKTR